MKSFPTVFPLSQIQRIVSIVSSGGTVANRAELVDDIFQVLEYAAGQLLGPSPAVGPLPSDGGGGQFRSESPTFALSDHEAVAQLQSSCEQASEAASGQLESLNINWLQLVQFLFTLFSRVVTPTA